MPLVKLSQVLLPALKHGHAVAGLVVLGWEDARAYVRAAEEIGSPVILQAGPGCRDHTPLPVLAAMFRSLGESATVPVVAHLDHGYTLEDCQIAIDVGFTSVMFDGSRKSLSENIEATQQIVELAHAADVSCEGEIGFVGYAEGEGSAGTDPKEAALFATKTGVDAMAVSVGNVHLQTEQAAEIDMSAVQAIEAVTNVPLVIHGGSGVPSKTRLKLAKETAVCKFNIGTELRMAFGSALRESVNADLKRFDRVSILQETEEPVQQATVKVLNGMGFNA